MIRQFHTPDGIIERELTPEEIIQFAEIGDDEALREQIKPDLDKANTIAGLKNIIKRMLK